MSKCLLLLFLISGAANAQGAPETGGQQIGISITYEQWEKLPVDLRDAYLSGAIDSLLLFAADARAQALSLHFYSCLKIRGFTGSRLAENIRSFTQGKGASPPSVQVAMLNYLVALWERSISEPG
jgi:hypothetical protein